MLPSTHSVAHSGTGGDELPCIVPATCCQDEGQAGGTGRNLPVDESVGAWAFIDTGAYESCIDQDLADQLALTLVDRRIVSGAGGKHELNVYLAEIDIPGILVQSGLQKAGLSTVFCLGEHCCEN